MKAIVKHKKVFMILPIVAIICGLFANIILLYCYIVFGYFRAGLFQHYLKQDLIILVIGFILAWAGVLISAIGIVLSEEKMKSIIGIILSVLFFVILRL